MSNSEAPTIGIKCPSCSVVFGVTMQPVQDVVAEWSDSVMLDQRRSVAGITSDGELILGIPLAAGKGLVSVPLGTSVPTAHGEQTFQLREIHPGVLKLHPSILDPQIHAYVTIVGVPKNWSDL